MNRFTVNPRQLDYSDTSIILLYAGCGQKRDKSHALYKAPNGDYLINHNIAIVKKHAPGADIISVLGYKYEDVIEELIHDVRIVLNEHYDKTGPARSAYLGLLAEMRNSTYIIYGDVVLDKRYFGHRDNYLIVDNNSKSNIGVIIENSRVSHMAYGLEKKWGQAIMLAGLNDVALFKNACKNGLIMHEVLNQAIDDGLRLQTVEI